MVQNIVHNTTRIAIIIRASYRNEGIEFFTKDEDSQQLGYMNREAGYVVAPHRHNIMMRKVHLTQEVLFVKSGRVRVDFYDNRQVYIHSTILETGDVILLADGGHGFKMLEASELIEVKQGPYSGETDRIRFDPVQEENVILR
jgi:mannose-6-phosphate isomerase-like protein (cupin superfamily)